MPRFVDYAQITCQAGNGGDGFASFRREKFVPRGGPDGGDGGKGGDVILVGDPHMTTLLDFRYKSNYQAKHGAKGGRKKCAGHYGADLILPVPLGCEVTDTETETLIGDVTQPGQQLVIARGGKGGRGNTHFVSATNQAPRRFEEGEPGEHRAIILELKMIADIGLIGLPNAGKSTLLQTLTAATPKVASYPFTTLHPNLGVIDFDHATRLVLADLPGLIEGASQGAGLGDRFLRHIERTGHLLHLVTDEEGLFDYEDLVERIELVHRELLSYGHALKDKPRAIVLSQTDRAVDHPEMEKTLSRLKERYGDAMAISSVSGEGLDTFQEYLERLAHQFQAERAEMEAEISQESTQSLGMPALPPSPKADSDFFVDFSEKG